MNETNSQSYYYFIQDLNKIHELSKSHYPTGIALLYIVHKRAFDNKLINILTYNTKEKIYIVDKLTLKGLWVLFRNNK